MRSLMEVTWMCEPCHDVYRAKLEQQAVEYLLRPRCIVCGQPMGVQQVISPENRRRKDPPVEERQSDALSFSVQ